MELTLKSVNGLLINDTTNFNAWFVTENGRGVYNAPDFDVTLVERAGRTPLASTVQQREKYFLVDIECRGIFADQWDNLKAYIFTGGSVPLVSTDKNGNDWTIDHIIPSDPPNHDISNLQSMCRRCNGYKSDRVMERVAFTSDRWQ